MSFLGGDVELLDETFKDEVPGFVFCGPVYLYLLTEPVVLVRSAH